MTHYDHAVWFAARNTPVFPLHTPIGHLRCSCSNSKCTNVGKHPRTAHGLKDGSTDPAVLARWFATWPESNYGVCTGTASGMIVLDVDPKKGGDTSIIKLENEIGPLPETWTVLTGGDGIHYYFKHPGGRVGNHASFMPGLDIRGDGGYVVGPGSLHVSGKRYAWEVSAHPDETELANAPAALLSLISRPSSKETLPGACWKAALLEKVSEGSRNQTVASLAGTLLRHRVDPRLALLLLHSLNQTHFNPPLSDEEVTRTVNSVAGAELRHRNKRGHYGK